MTFPSSILSLYLPNKKLFKSMEKINLCAQHRNLFKLKKYISNVWTLIFWKSEIFLTLLCLCIIQAQNFFQENAMRNWVLKYRILHFFLQIYYLFRLSIKKCSLSSPSLSLLFSSWSSFFAWTRFWNWVKIVIHYALLILNALWNKLSIWRKLF